MGSLVQIDPDKCVSQASGVEIKGSLVVSMCFLCSRMESRWDMGREGEELLEQFDLGTLKQSRNQAHAAENIACVHYIYCFLHTL